MEPADVLHEGDLLVGVAGAASAANDGDYNPRGKPAEQVLRTWQGAGPQLRAGGDAVECDGQPGASGASTIGITRTGGFTGSVASPPAASRAA